MITHITGQLVALEENSLTLRVGAFQYEVLIPEFTRRQLQSQCTRKSDCTRSSTSKAIRCRAG